MATLRAMPVLEVAEIARSGAFYSRLGFDGHGAWGDPPGFLIVQRGDVTIGLTVPQSTKPVRNEWWAAYVYVSDAPALHAEFAREGLAPTTPQPREYGLIDFDVIDPDGHRISFGSDLSSGPHGPGLGPERGRG
ncbi:MAG: VOC family protein [Pseudomonadota bacterium]